VVEFADELAVILLPVVPLFFWVRGMIKGRRGDLLAAFCIFAATSVILLVSLKGSFAHAALPPIVLGVATLALSRSAHPDCPLTRRERIGLGWGAVITGLLMSTIL